MAGDVDGEDAWCGLRYRHDIHKLFTAQPVVLVYIFTLHDGNHGIATTQGERSYLIACKEKV